MKKIVLLFSLVSLIQLNSNAQVEPHAIGLRFGSGNYGSGAEISYQHGFGNKNRLEMDLGWRTIGYHPSNKNWNYSKSSHIALSGIYHWDFNIAAGFNWYIGPGAQLGLFSYKYYDYDKNWVYREYTATELSLAVGGQIGIEYNFNEHGVPLLLSLDARPMWNLMGNYSGGDWGAALSIRYTF